MSNIYYLYRIFEGSQFRKMLESKNTFNITPSENSWLDGQKKIKILKLIECLRSKSSHIVDHLNDNDLSLELIIEIHYHILEMEKLMNFFHSHIEKSSQLWKKKRRLQHINIPYEGSQISSTLMVPLIIDSLMDGLLMGLSISISFKVGVILLFVTTMEMSLLGLIISVRIKKCTGSSLWIQALSLMICPIVMYCFYVLGILFSSILSLNIFYFKVFIAFSIASLVNLTCNDLLYDARQACNSEDYWWNSALLLLGILLTVISDKLQTTNI